MMSKLLVPAIAVVLLASAVSADVYMQFPRGSNNRLNEANRDRNNANRLFNSQNNNRGGYNTGQVYFYTGTTMNIEWTNQHSCGGPNNNCEMILQYTCDDLIRDGATTNRITVSAAADKDPQFGRHESYQYYTQQCMYRSRNKGLFTANQNLGGTDARFTRQQPNNNQYGFECPEEREYYPYWHPTMWRDVAVLTNDGSRCPYYQAESQNVKGRYKCTVPSDWMAAQVAKGQTGFIPINGTECVKIRSPTLVDQYNNSLYATWDYVAPWNTDAPVCSNNFVTRDNHLGNVAGGFPASFNWTIPADVLSERCVLRLRYNISTFEYAGFADVNNAEGIAPLGAPSNLTRRNNSCKTNPNAATDVALIDVYSKYGLSWGEVNASYPTSTVTCNSPAANSATVKASRGYVFRNDPIVDIFGNSLVPRGSNAAAPNMVRLQLAFDTTQFGRTFQDRSHRFAIRAKPSQYGDTRIYNVQVKGRRGNIVQVFPGTEYDFWPKRLQVRVGEYVHFQWTGSNNNGDNNAGRGKAGTDRHNIVMLRDAVFPYAAAALQTADSKNEVQTIGALGSTYPTRVDGANATFLGLSKADMGSLASWSNYQFGGDLDQGDDAGTYFDLGPRQATAKGIFNYACTRNNDFSNRDQKATIIVSSQAAVFASFGSAGGVLRADSGAAVTADAGVFTAQVTISIVTSPASTSSSFSGTPSSDYVTVAPNSLPLATGATIRVSIPFDNKPLVIPKMYRGDSMFADNWDTVSASFSGGTANADVSQGGVYVVKADVNWGAVVGIIIGAVGFVGIIVGVMYWRFKKQQAAGGATDKAPKASNV